MRRRPTQAPRRGQAARDRAIRDRIRSMSGWERDPERPGRWRRRPIPEEDRPDKADVREVEKNHRRKADRIAQRERRRRNRAKLFGKGQG